MRTKMLGTIRSAEFGTYKGMPHLMGLQLDFKLADGNGITNDGNLSYHAEGSFELYRQAQTLGEVYDLINNTGGTKVDPKALALQQQARVMEAIYHILKGAKVNHISELIGLPVEVVMDGSIFVSFKILTEVL